MSRLFRFRRFRARLLVMVLGLLVAALGTTYVLVSRANLESAQSHSESNLQLGSRVYDRVVRQRIEYLAGSASVMTQDYAIKQVLLEEHPQTLTLSSNLKSFTTRVGAPVIALFGTDGELIANSQEGMDNENRGPFAYLIRLAGEHDTEQENGFAYLDRQLHVLVVVPLYAPYPNVFAWFGLAFPLDRKFAAEIKETTLLEVTIVSTDEPGKPRVLATTLSESQAGLVAQAVEMKVRPNGGHAIGPQRVTTLDVGGEPFVTLFKSQEMLGDDPVTVVLQRPLMSELAAARALENKILLFSLAALGIAVVAAAGIARGVAKPVQELAEHTRQVAAGDYGARIELRREDELGQLATAFNRMTEGLAERDRVRDLLGKVVSPEIASQLLHTGVELGGEERQVTILFSDLRDFTTLSERMPPAEMLALLNRYLDRMSTIIERHGGVIDKYIGDAIMALFGAPVAGPGAADRAIAAAREMVEALRDLNGELAAEGRPALAFGIGINTAVVVAGNMGSRRRLNYTVIGDGVNLASRLEGLTKDSSYGTSVICSEATITAAKSSPPARELGSVKVKGKAQAVKIFAVDEEGSLKAKV